MDELTTFLFYFVPVIALIMAIIWIVVLIDLVRSDFEKKSEKLTWILVVTALGVIGAILYLEFGKKKRKSGIG